MALEEPVLISLNPQRGTGWSRSLCSPWASCWGAKTTCICCCQLSNGIFMIYYTIAPSQQWHYTLTTAVKSLNVGRDRCWLDTVGVMYVKCCSSADVILLIWDEFHGWGTAAVCGLAIRVSPERGTSHLKQHILLKWVIQEEKWF